MDRILLFYLTNGLICIITFSFLSIFHRHTSTPKLFYFLTVHGICLIWDCQSACSRFALSSLTYAGQGRWMELEARFERQNKRMVFTRHIWEYFVVGCVEWLHLSTNNRTGCFILSFKEEMKLYCSHIKKRSPSNCFNPFPSITISGRMQNL